MNTDDIALLDESREQVHSWTELKYTADALLHVSRLVQQSDSWKDFEQLFKLGGFAAEAAAVALKQRFHEPDVLAAIKSGQKVTNISHEVLPEGIRVTVFTEGANNTHSVITISLFPSRTK
jgi:hypothetical protein